MHQEQGLCFQMVVIQYCIRESKDYLGGVFIPPSYILIRYDPNPEMLCPCDHTKEQLNSW